MADVGKAITSLLENGATGVAPYPFYAEPETFDNTNEEYITYAVRSVAPSDTKSGVSLVDEVEVEVVCFGKSYLSLLSLADNVRSDLDRAAYGTYNGVQLGGVQYVSTDEDFDRITERHEIEMVFRFRVKNPVE